MPNPFFRATSPASRHTRTAPKRVSRKSAPNLIEGLEERRLFALAVAPFSTAPSATALGNQILVPGTGLTITGGSYVGANGQGGTYSGLDLVSPTNTLVIQDGVLLTTGLASQATGPNVNTQSTFLHGTAGDADLSTLIGQGTFDANTLTLQFTAAPGTISIQFDFIFGSDEFRELRGNVVTDAFAAFVDGTQAVFDQGTPPRPMNINNSLLTVDNSFIGTPGLLNIEYDGLTPRLRVRAPLNTALTTHTIKFVIADAGPRDFGNIDIESGVFISRLQGSTVLLGAAATGEPAPGVLQFSAADYTVAETGGLATILVQRVGATQGAVSVNYTVTDGTAVNGQDYTATTGTILLQDQQSSATFTVPILDDTAAEGNETVVLTLSNSVDAPLGTPTVATLTIVENEAGIRFADPTPFDTPVVYGVSENVVNAVITIERFGDLGQPATVNYATLVEGSTATAGEDYGAISGTLTFAPGESTKTISIPVRADFVDESTETVALALSGASAGTQLGQGSTATLEIFDLNRPPSLYDVTAVAPRGRIEAFLLKFNTDMIPETVRDIDNYRLYLHNENKPGGKNRTALPIQPPEYDAAAKTVTLRPTVALRHNVFYEIVARTRTLSGIRALGGEMIDGNLNGQLDIPAFFGGPVYSGPPDGTGLPGTITGYLDSAPGEDFIGYFGRGTKLVYTDQNGDRVRLGLSGPGVLEVLRDPRGEARTVRVVGAPATSVVFGRVTRRGRSDGVTTIDDLLLGGVQNQIVGPQFQSAWVL